jgi:HSP90 family molecular chaperone
MMMKRKKMKKKKKRKTKPKNQAKIKRRNLTKRNTLISGKNSEKNIKLGIIEDPGNRSKLAKLTRWYSSKNTTELTSFDEYLSRAK